MCNLDVHGRLASTKVKVRFSFSNGQYGTSKFF
jgi:hypothetical protein